MRKVAQTGANHVSHECEPEVQAPRNVLRLLRPAAALRAILLAAAQPPTEKARSLREPEGLQFLDAASPTRPVHGAHS